MARPREYVCPLCHCGIYSWEQRAKHLFDVHGWISKNLDRMTLDNSEQPAATSPPTPGPEQSGQRDVAGKTSRLQWLLAQRGKGDKGG
jgi:hypothetical protein